MPNKLNNISWSIHLTLKNLKDEKMKTLKYIVSIIILFAGIQAFGQTTTKTETFKVYGNCGMCKARIEKAAKVDGVTKAEWDKTTKMMVVNFDPSKITSDKIQKKIAGIGHDTEKYKADDKAYAKLPGCCQYERKK